MKKYFAVFKISLQQEFAYKLNFIMWRVRNIMQIIIIFFLWDTIFADPSRQLFGYDRARILTYVFGILVLKALVFSARSVDIAGEISRGDILNFLIRPVNYFYYWFTRDISSKVLNIAFAILEITVLYFLLKPPIFLQTNVAFGLMFILSFLAAILLYFLLIFLFSLLTFWFPEQAWGVSFLLMIFSDFLGGGVFPLDILPSTIQNIVYATPFPYLLFMPLQIYLGKLSILQVSKALVISYLWVCILFMAVRYIWNLGLKAYQAEGK